jgi:ceramide glucosyltransferase
MHTWFVVEWMLVSLTVFGMVVVLAMLGAQWRQLRAARRLPGVDLPPVSVLKPMKGIDADLESNLESFFVLDYPAYELVFGVDRRDDPALEVARRVAARHPEVSVRFAIGGSEIGFNPKVNNLANILRHARYEVLLISDSNVAVDRSYLRTMAARLAEHNVGLVTSYIRGVGGSGLGGALEGLQLNTFVMGGVAMVGGLGGRVCSVGKSMLLRRSDLERIGGFAELGRYLAEDQICGELIEDLGRRVVVAAPPVDNVLGRLSVRRFAGRHLRWARIRRRISPPGYAAELLTNPLPAAAALVAVNPGPATAAVAVATLGGLCAAAIASEHLLGVRRPLRHYPVLVVLRSLLVAVLWPVPFLNSTVTWRGRCFTVGVRTLLVPEQQMIPEEFADLAPEEVVV